MKECPNCGTNNPDDNDVCFSCGKPLPKEGGQETGELPPGPMTVGGTPSTPMEPVVISVPEEPTLQAPPSTPDTTPPPPLPPGVPAPPPPPGGGHPGPYNGMPGAPSQAPSQLGLFSLIAGILSITCCWVCNFGLLAGPAAIVLAILARKDPTANQGMATAGLVLGISGTVLTILLFVLGIIGAISEDTFRGWQSS